MLSKPLHILITGVGGPTPRSFARALQEFGSYKQYKLFATDITPYAIGLYQNKLFQKGFITPRSSQAGYWESMEKIISENDIDIAIILPETEAHEWSKRQKEGALPCKALIPDLSFVETVMDKSTLTAALEPYGLVPASVAFSSQTPGLKGEIELKLQYPFWVRSATGSSGLGSYKVQSWEDLMRWISINPEVGTFLASTFLPGRNLACKFLYYNGELVRSAVGERVNYIMSKISPSGITGNTSFGRLLNAPEVFDAAKKAIDLVFDCSGARRHGFFTVDLKEDAFGVPKITEINVRHVAFTAAFAAGGANLCEDTIRLLDDDPDFDQGFHLYRFPEGLIFLRDVDSRPVMMLEKDLLV